MAHTGQKFDLEQMQDYFEREAAHIRCISDYQLSEDDFKSLAVKLKGLFMVESSMDWLHEFILPITIYSVYSHIYDVSKVCSDFTFRDLQKRLSQYQMRRHIQNMLECIHDYGLLDFGYSRYEDTVACRMTVARHAGIPNDEKYQVFDMVSQYRGALNIEGLVTDIYAKLPPKTKRIFDVLDETSRWEVLLEIWELIQTCRDVRSSGEVLKKHPNLSVSLVDYCCFWSENQRMLLRIGS